MYLNFFILIFDYFRSLSFRIAVYELILPVIFTTSYIFIVDPPYLKTQINSLQNIPELNSNAITILGIFVGFSIAMFTILTTSSNRNIENIKQWKTDTIISNEQISLYRLLLINISYSVLISSLLIIIDILFIIFTNKANKTINSINIMFISHVLLLNIRNITDFYLVITKNSNSNQQ